MWSYGVVMWEIYSFGRAPYPRMNQKDVVEKVQAGYRMEKPESCPKVRPSTPSHHRTAPALGRPPQPGSLVALVLLLSWI